MVSLVHLMNTTLCVCTTHTLTHDSTVVLMEQLQKRHRRRLLQRTVLLRQSPNSCKDSVFLEFDEWSVNSLCCVKWHVAVLLLKSTSFKLFPTFKDSRERVYDRTINVLLRKVTPDCAWPRLQKDPAKVKCALSVSMSAPSSSTLSNTGVDSCTYILVSEFAMCYFSFCSPAGFL